MLQVLPARFPLTSALESPGEAVAEVKGTSATESVGVRTGDLEQDLEPGRGPGRVEVERRWRRTRKKPLIGSVISAAPAGKASPATAAASTWKMAVPTEVEARAEPAADTWRLTTRLVHLVAHGAREELGDQFRWVLQVAVDPRRRLGAGGAQAVDDGAAETAPADSLGGACSRGRWRCRPAARDGRGGVVVAVVHEHDGAGAAPRR